MRTLLTTSALALGLALPTLASAETLSFSAGATLASTFVSNGIDVNDGPVLQPWLEGSYGGFYFGAWMSTLDKDFTGDGLETDLYVGYRGEAGAFSYDLAYYHYFYDNSGKCCGEWIASLGYAVNDQLSLGLTLKHDPASPNNPEDVINSSVSIDYALNDKVGLFASYGGLNKGGHDYYSLGASYALTDAWGVSLAWHDTNLDLPQADGVAVLALDYAFDWK